MTNATLRGNLDSGDTPVRFDGRRIGGICIFCSFLAMTAVAAPTVTINGVAQRWPWNNKVDITYTVTNGQDVATSTFRKLKFNAVINGETTVIDGDTLGASASDGQHTVTWKAPSGLKPTTMTLTASMYASDDPSGDDYMILDLDDGTVKYEGLLDSQAASDARYNTATYKTDKMVLRKVPAGTYPAKGRDCRLHLKDFPAVLRRRIHWSIVPYIELHRKKYVALMTQVLSNPTPPASSFSV